MGLEKIKENAVDLATSPQVNITATSVTWTLAQVTAEQWLTYLSIAAVVIQIIVSLPKMIEQVARYIYSFKKGKRKGLRYGRKK